MIEDRAKDKMKIFKIVCEDFSNFGHQQVLSITDGRRQKKALLKESGVE
jgi:hypothetical protein